MCDSDYNSAFKAAGSWEGLIACNPGGLFRLEDEPGSPLQDNWEWQCVELSERWLNQEFHLPAQTGINGYQTVQAYWDYIQKQPAGKYPLKLVTPANATKGSLGPGDVISYADVKGDDGHTDVVTSTSPAPFNGTGTVTTLNENNGGFITVKVSDWKFGIPDHLGNHMAATGWLHYELPGWKAIRAPLPPDATAQPHVYLQSVTCPSPSFCAAAGNYLDSTGQQGLLLTGSGTRWTATKAPLPPNVAAAGGNLESVACPSSSRCVAVGSYTDSAGADQALLLTWSGKGWTPKQAPLPAHDPGGKVVGGSLVAVACASAAMCVAAGTYNERYPIDGETFSYGMLLTWNGTSWTAIKAPVPAGGRAGSAMLPWSGTACSATSCLVVGSYYDSSNIPQGLLLTWSGRAWTAAKAPVPAGTNLSNGQAGLYGAACPSSSACVAAGFYQVYTTSARNYGWVLTGAGKTWKVADTVSGQMFWSVACPSQTSCAVSGIALMVTGSGTTWRSTTAPSPAAGGLLVSVSCPSASSCAVAAQSPSGTWGQPDGALVITGAGSTWTSMLAPLPSGSGGAADLNWIACASVTTCVAVGEDNSEQGIIMSGPS